jgi:glycerol-3-phosphate O-acyltransferase
MAHDRAPSTPGSSSQALRRQAEAWGTGMLRRFGWFHWLLGLRRALAHVKLDDASAERVRDAAATGPVVYVMLRASNLDYLALNHVLNQRRLPLSIWANGVTQFFWQPVVQAWSGLFQRAWAHLRGDAPADPVTSGWLAEALADDAPVTLFLEPAAGLWRGVGFRWSDPVPALIDAQSKTDLPIQVLPVVVLWQRGLSRPVHPALRAVLPDPERPWGISRLLKLVLFPSDSVVVIGAAVDLGEFLARVPVAERRPRTLYALLRRYLRREGEVVRGPRLPSRAALRTLVLDNPPMRAIAEAEAARSGHSIQRVRRRMEREYDRIAAHMRWWVIRFLDVALRPLWTRVYSGVDAPEPDIERIREAIRQGAAIALPSHKSHFDYLLLAWVFYQHKLTLPHVVAGMNLAIPVVSFFLRSAGGFFIERSFAGKTLHPHIFARYLRELVHHGAPIEFYMEGGRTRSGKLLAPKVGVLEMVFDAAALRPTGREVTLLPIALAYEQVAEQRAYVRELSGAKKRKEDLGEVARASQIVGRRLGKVYLRVGAPISVGALVDVSDEQPPWAERLPATRRATLDRVARAVMHQVGNHTVLLPTTLVALGLLAHHRRGIRQLELLARIGRFRVLIARHGVPEAASLARFDEAIRLSLARLAEQRVIEPLEHDGERVWAVRVERRLELDFAKNQGMHPFAVAGIAIAALRGRLEPGVAPDAIDADVAWLARLWRREFLLDPELDAAGLRAAGLADLEAHGAITISDGAVTLADRDRAAEVYGLFAPFLEAYRIVAELAPALGGERLGRKEWVTAVQRRGDALLAAGLATRPESLSLVTLENAVKTLIDDGILAEGDGGRLAPDSDRLAALRARLDPMVGR